MIMFTQLTRYVLGFLVRVSVRVCNLHLVLHCPRVSPFMGETRTKDNDTGVFLRGNFGSLSEPREHPSRPSAR